MPRCNCGPGARGICPHSIRCPACKAAPWKPCKRPSGYTCEMHSERYRKPEQDDARACPGFEPLQARGGVGCRNCSGLPEDHAKAQATLF